MDVEVNAILPADESGHGFDNVTVGDLPPMLLSRYITAAQQISRLAVGSSIRSPEGINVRVPADRTQAHMLRACRWELVVELFSSTNSPLLGRRVRRLARQLVSRWPLKR